MNEERGSWYLLTAVILGIALGLWYSWVGSPAEYVDTAPDSLRTDFKDVYRVTIASAYAATGDIARAKARLALLGDDDPAPAPVRPVPGQTGRPCLDGRVARGRAEGRKRELQPNDRDIEFHGYDDGRINDLRAGSFEQTRRGMHPFA